MARVFISYAHEDRALAERLAGAIEALGHKVWWDAKLAPGRRFRPDIEAALRDATVVVVIWTPISVRKDFVLDEAEMAKGLERLLPVVFDPGVKVPMGFGQLHYINLDGLTGAQRDMRLMALGRAIAALQDGDRYLEVISEFSEGPPQRPGGEALRALRELGATVGGLPIGRFAGGVLAASALAAMVQTLAEMIAGPDEAGSNIVFVTLVAAVASAVARASAQFLLLARNESSFAFFDRTFSFWSLLTLLIAALLFAIFMNGELSAAELTTEALVFAFGAVALLFLARTFAQLSRILAARASGPA